MKEDIVFHKVFPHWLRGKHAARHPVVHHLGEGIRHQPRIPAGHKCAVHNLKHQKNQQHHQQTCKTRLGMIVHPAFFDRQHPSNPPHVVRIQEKGGGEMGCQTIVTNVRQLDQPTLYHVPAQHPLKRDQQAHREQGRPSLAGNFIGEEKKDEGNKPNQANHPAKHPMQEFPEEDLLKLGKLHIGTQVLVLGVGFIAIEDFLPLQLGGRRNHPHNGIPVYHGQAGAGKAGRSADGDHDQNRGIQEVQPTD